MVRMTRTLSTDGKLIREIPNTTLTGNISPTSQSITGTLNKNADLSGIGTVDYDKLKNKPSIENIMLEGNKSFEDFGLDEASNQDILELFR